MDGQLAISNCHRRCRHRRHHHHHHHHLANMELGHFLTRSVLAHLEVSLSPLVSSFTTIYYGAFCLYVATNFYYILVFCPKLGLNLVLLQSLCVFFNLSKEYSAVFLTYFMSAAVVLHACPSLMVHFSLLYSTTGRASVLCSFILLFFKVFCDLNIIVNNACYFQIVFNVLSVSTSFNISNFLRCKKNLLVLYFCYLLQFYL